MSNTLIVESENDEYFIEALTIKLSSETQIERVYKYKHSSLSKKDLIITLSITLTHIVSRTDTKTAKIGLIIDMDNATEAERIELINECLISAFDDCGYPKPLNLLATTSQFVTNKINDELHINISCFFTNIDGEGELETVLKAIKSQDSIFADCLYKGWVKCLEQHGKVIGTKGEQCDISDKELLKLWVDFYKRFDTLKRPERNAKNTDWKGIMLGQTKANEPLNKARGADIFDLNSSELDDIKQYLSLFD